MCARTTDSLSLLSSPVLSDFCLVSVLAAGGGEFVLHAQISRAAGLNDLAGQRVHVVAVAAAAMQVHVLADLLLLRRTPHDAHPLARQPDCQRPADGPCQHGGQPDELRGHLHGHAARLLVEQSRHEDAPEPRCAMHRRRTEGVIHLDPEAEVLEEDERDARPNARQHGAPRVHAVAPAADGHQPRQHAVGQRLEVVRQFLPVQVRLDHKTCHSSESAAECGVCGDD
mmetsp:Transcript_8265/g.23541  ORF Transcript_8265/g.23541 Transcript_8265/m.23541 type:complete len:227 (+) Transcript_8265:248-928(+)